MQGGELSSFHDGRFPIISLSMSFQSGRAMCFNLFANKFSETPRGISAPAIAQGTQLSATSCDFDRNDSLTFYIRTSGSFSALYQIRSEVVRFSKRKKAQVCARNKKFA